MSTIALPNASSWDLSLQNEQQSAAALSWFSDALNLGDKLRICWYHIGMPYYCRITYQDIYIRIRMDGQVADMMDNS